MIFLPEALRPLLTKVSKSECSWSLPCPKTLAAFPVFPVLTRPGTVSVHHDKGALPSTARSRPMPRPCRCTWGRTELSPAGSLTLCPARDCACSFFPHYISQSNYCWSQTLSFHTEFKSKNSCFGKVYCENINEYQTSLLVNLYALNTVLTGFSSPLQDNYLIFCLTFPTKSHFFPTCLTSAPQGCY